MKIIEWKPIKGFDGYFINELGEVKSTRTYKGTKEKILKSHKNQQGYLVYTLMRFGKPYLKPLHRLLMETFKPNKEKLPCINHIDGNILNNSLDNLEWCTYGHNEKEAYRLGLKQSRIKPKQVVQLTKNYEIEFANNTFNVDITSLFPKSRINEDGILVDEKNNEIEVEDLEINVEVPFEAVTISDDSEASDIHGNIISMIYLGDRYQIIVRTEDEEDFILETPDLWNENDIVSVIIDQSMIRISRKGVKK